MQPFSSFLSGYFQNIRGSGKTGSSRAPDQEINFVGDAFRLCDRIKVPKFHFIKHSGYSHKPDTEPSFIPKAQDFQTVAGLRWPGQDLSL
jgi:hypothetical protein